MSFQERNDQGPEDGPAPELVEQLAKALWRAGENRPLEVYAWAELKIAERDWFRDLADERIRAGQQQRVICPGWGDDPHGPRVIRRGLEPVSHRMCDYCAPAFTAS